jgi:transcriptional regulator with XRE-family HTH domain
MLRSRKRPDPWQDEFYMRLGRRIRQWRGARGLMQRELADTLGISRPAMANVEAGRQAVTADFLWRAAAALKVAPKTLMPRLASSCAARREQRLEQRAEVLASRSSLRENGR